MWVTVFQTRKNKTPVLTCIGVRHFENAPPPKFSSMLASAAVCGRGEFLDIGRLYSSMSSCTSVVRFQIQRGDRRVESITNMDAHYALPIVKKIG